MSFETLPPELRREIFSYVDPIQACALRLVSKALLPFGNERAFSLVIVKNGWPNPHAEAVLNSQLRNYVAQVIYQSDTDGSYPLDKKFRRNLFTAVFPPSAIRTPGPPTSDPKRHAWQWMSPHLDPHLLGPAEFAEWHKRVQGYLPTEEAEYLEDQEWGLQRGHNARIRKLLQHLSTLPCLQSVVLIFHPYYSSPARDRDVFDRLLEEAYQPVQERDYILRDLFRVLEPVQTLKMLQIYHHLDTDNKHLVAAPFFRNVLNRLDELGLYIIGEGNHEEEDEVATLDIRASKLVCSFPQTWLPHCRRLKRLAIMMHDFWGYRPHADLRHLHFPRLKALQMGGWCISQQWQVDWLVSHASTLRRLGLVQCPIIMFDGARIDEPEFLPRMSEEQYAAAGLAKPQDQPLCWHGVYKQLRKGLPKLVVFCTGGWSVYDRLLYENNRPYEESTGGIMQKFEFSDSDLDKMRALWWSESVVSDRNPFTSETAGVRTLRNPPCSEKNKVDMFWTRFGSRLYHQPYATEHVDSEWRAPLRFYAFIESTGIIKPASCSFPRTWNEAAEYNEVMWSKSGVYTREDRLEFLLLLGTVKERALREGL